MLKKITSHHGSFGKILLSFSFLFGVILLNSNETLAIGRGINMNFYNATKTPISVKRVGGEAGIYCMNDSGGLKKGYYLPANGGNSHAYFQTSRWPCTASAVSWVKIIYQDQLNASNSITCTYKERGKFWQDSCTTTGSPTFTANFSGGQQVQHNTSQEITSTVNLQ